MSIGSRMKERRESLGLTQVQLADMLGVTKGAIGNYETGANSPKASLMFKVFEVLKCDANYIFQDEIKELETDDLTVPEIKMIKKYRLLAPDWKEAVDSITDIGYRRCLSALKEKQRQEPTETAEELAPETVYFTVPCYESPMSAGTGQLAGDGWAEDYRLIKAPPRGTSYIAPVCGDSMEPTFRDGDRLFIHSTVDIRPGQIGVFFMDGQQWVKELGNGVLLSHNKKYAPVHFTEDVQCQGLVLGVCDDSYFE